MSQQRLPILPNMKPICSDFDIAVMMNNHRKRMEEVKHRKSIGKINQTINYRDMYQENPKRNYFLQTKYTQIERENRLLFEKISGLNKNRKKHYSLSENHMGTLNTTFRKQQIEEIERENVKMFGRIQRQKPSISFRQTDKDYSRSKEIASRLSNLHKNKLHDWYS